MGLLNFYPHDRSYGEVIDDLALLSKQIPNSICSPADRAPRRSLTHLGFRSTSLKFGQQATLSKEPFIDTGRCLSRGN